MADLLVDIESKVGNFSLQVAFTAAGGVVGVLGTSGAGKTVALRSIAGLLRPRSGRVMLDGRVLYDGERGAWVPVRHRGIGYVFQEYALFPHLTVAQNLGYGLARWPRTPAQLRVQELVRLLQLEGLEQRRPSQISGGQQQRVALGRTLAPQPALLLLDEPFSAVDAPTRTSLTEQFQALRERLGFMAVLVTHDMTEAYALASYLVLLEAGRVVQQGPREEVYRRPASPAAARLLGVRNLLNGIVVSVSTERTLVDIGGGRVAAEASDLSPGTRVTVGIRPEEVVLTPDPELVEEAPVSALLGSLVQRTDRGSHHSLLLALDGASGPGLLLHVELSDACARGFGPTLPARWTAMASPSAVHLWPQPHGL